MVSHRQGRDRISALGLLLLSIHWRMSLAPFALRRPFSHSEITTNLSGNQRGPLKARSSRFGAERMMGPDLGKPFVRPALLHGSVRACILCGRRMNSGEVHLGALIDENEVIVTSPLPLLHHYRVLTSDSSVDVPRFEHEHERQHEKWRERRNSQSPAQARQVADPSNHPWHHDSTRVAQGSQRREHASASG